MREKIIDLLSRFFCLTKEDKAEIRQMCKDVNIKANFNSRCKECYKDALLLLKLHYNVRTEDETETPSGNYVYTKGDNYVIWTRKHFRILLNSQSSDKQIEEYMATHPHQTAFKRVERDENAESGTDTQPVAENVSDGDSDANNGKE